MKGENIYMKLIVINGMAGVGKDQFVSYAKNSDAAVYNCSCVDRIKELALTIGWDGIKDEKGRRLLSDLKDTMERYNDLPFQSIIRDIEFITANEAYTDDIIIFIHAREPKDIQRWKDEHNAKSLLIRRAAAETEHDNHADQNVFDYDYDYVYSNDGDLQQ
jgi:dephospho-CoA kinase